MGIKTYRPYTPSRRNMTGSDFSEITKKTPERSLLSTVKENAGRNNQGKITVRHRVVETDRSTESSISRETARMVSLQPLSESSMIRTELPTSHSSLMLMVRRHTSSLRTA